MQKRSPAGPYSNAPEGLTSGNQADAIGATTRKAPAFLQGLLQFGFSLERETGIEPATLCLGIVFKGVHVVPR
jgi:hypothetical protein